MNSKIVDEMSILVHQTRARSTGLRIVEKLQKDIPRQLFLITIQAKVGSKIVGRADVKPYRKDVTAKCVS